MLQVSSAPKLSNWRFDMPAVSGSTALITLEENSCQATKISAQIGQALIKKLIMIHSSLSPTDERLAGNTNYYYQLMNDLPQIATSYAINQHWS